MSRDTLRIGVIGFGQWGPNHVRTFGQMDGVEVVRVADASATRREAAAKFLRGVQVTERAEEVWAADDIDAVVVATPTRTHFPLVAAALRSGKDVLCEKPLAPTAAECRELVELARQRDRVLMTGHVFLYNPGVAHLRADLTRGDLGRIHYMDAVRTNLGPVRADVGVIHDLASHDISIFNHLVGAAPVEVSATGGSVLRAGVEDVAFLTLRYPDEVLCHVHVSWLNPRKVRQLTIVGDRKMSVWDDMNNLEPIRHYDKGVSTQHYASFGEFQLILRDGQITIPKVRMAEPLQIQDVEFAACVRERRSPLADGEFGLGVVRVIEAAMVSLKRHGRAVEISV